MSTRVQKKTPKPPNEIILDSGCYKSLVFLNTSARLIIVHKECVDTLKNRTGAQPKQLRAKYQRAYMREYRLGLRRREK